MRHDEWVIKENIAQIRQLMSDQNLQLLPDYEQRLAVLRDLEFIDEKSRVLLKGKVACEVKTPHPSGRPARRLVITGDVANFALHQIHSADELVLTELILENVLAEFEPEEIVALLSAFVFQEKTDQSPTLTSNLEKVTLMSPSSALSHHTDASQGKETIIKISEKVNSFQIQHQVILSSDDSNDFVSRPRFGLAEVVYEWARGMSFNLITDLTDVLEGTIVRVITRLDETCREVKNAARIIGDPTLFTKMQECQEMIRRDITAVASLYVLFPPCRGLRASLARDLLTGTYLQIHVTGSFRVVSRTRLGKGSTCVAWINPALPGIDRDTANRYHGSTAALRDLRRFRPQGTSSSSRRTEKRG